MLRIKGLTKRYRTGDLALKGVDIDVPDGQVMALIGPSGAGKSTLIRCVNRLVEPTSGSIALNDVDIVKLGAAELRRARRRMGMIFQEYALVERLSVMENVLTGRLGYVGFWQSWLRRFPQSDIDAAFRLLERVGLDHMADKRADELSGGQRQRVGICRALIQNPELLLVDEPTASLDPKTSRQIMRLIRELCEERKLSAIINIHDVMLAQMFAERIVGLRLGEIVYDGPPDELTPAVLTSIYGEEDWSATIRKVGEEAGEAEEDNVLPFDPPRPDRNRLARQPGCPATAGPLAMTAERPCVPSCHRTPPLEKAAADRVGLAAPDARNRGCGLSRVGVPDDAGELGAGMGWLAARCGIHLRVLPAGFCQPLGRNRRRHCRKSLDDGRLYRRRHRALDSRRHRCSEKHRAGADLLFLPRRARDLAALSGRHPSSLLRQAVRLRAFRRLRDAFVRHYRLLRQAACRGHRGYGPGAGGGRPGLGRKLAAMD